MLSRSPHNFSLAYVYHHRGPLHSDAEAGPASRMGRMGVAINVGPTLVPLALRAIETDGSPSGAAVLRQVAHSRRGGAHAEVEQGVAV